MSSLFPGKAAWELFLARGCELTRQTGQSKSVMLSWSSVARDFDTTRYFRQLHAMLRLCASKDVSSYRRQSKHNTPAFPSCVPLSSCPHMQVFEARRACNSGISTNEQSGVTSATRSKTRPAKRALRSSALMGYSEAPESVSLSSVDAARPHVRRWPMAMTPMLSRGLLTRAFCMGLPLQ